MAYDGFTGLNKTHNSCLLRWKINTHNKHPLSWWILKRLNQSSINTNRMDKDLEFRSGAG